MLRHVAARPSGGPRRPAAGVTHFLAAGIGSRQHGSGHARHDSQDTPRAMNDRRMLRRYLVMVSHAEEVLEASFGNDAVPPPAEAIAVIEDLVLALGSVVRRMPAAAPRPQDIAESLAGWVH